MKKNSECVTIGLVGDVNMRNIPKDGRSLSNLESEFGDTDVLIGNLEGCLYDSSTGLEFKPGLYHAGEGYTPLLKRMGFTVLGCANNTMYGTDAIASTLRQLDREGISHTGAGMDSSQASAASVVTAKNKRIGVISHTTVFWPVGHAANQQRAGVAVIRVSTSYRPHPRTFEMPGVPPIVVTDVDSKDLVILSKTIQTLRSNVDIVVASFHWGVSGSREVVDYQRTLARRSI